MARLRRELLDAILTLNRLLRRRPWEFDIVWADDSEPPPYVTDWQRRLAYRKAHTIHLTLVELAVEQARRQAREQAARK